MKRDPKEEYINYYNNSIKIKKIYPLLFWKKCERCGMEYIREPMYKCDSIALPDLPVDMVHYGCTNCFNNQWQFKNWLQKAHKLKDRQTLEDRYRVSLFF